MAYSITKQGDSVQNYVLELAADTRADIELLPTDCQVGSTCIVIADSSVWMLGSDGNWHEL